MPGSRYLFVGPTLPDAADLTGGTGVTVMPPVAAGDLLALRPRSGDRLGIVDGYFHQARAVPHKEIMSVLADGVQVFGASSMGALRATELGRWGMVGVGEVFESYRDGILVADDEVALLHGPAEDGYPHLSEPLVTIRARLAAAVAAGLCSREQAASIVRDLAALPYRERTDRLIETMAASAGLGTGEAARLREYCRTQRRDPKRDDALMLLRHLTGDDVVLAAPPSPPPRTIYLHDWQLATERGQLRAMRVCQVLALEYPLLHAALVREQLASECARQCSSTDTDSVTHAVHRGVLDSGRCDPPFLACWSTPEERKRLNTTALLELFVVRGFRVQPGIAATDLALQRLRRHPGWPRALTVARRVEDINSMGRAHRPDFDPSATAADQILPWLAARWQWPQDDLELAAFDRGFDSLAAAVAAARPLHLAALCDPQTRYFSLGPNEA